MEATTLPSRLDILAMARELVLDEFEDRREQLLDRWLLESQMYWNNYHVTLPYPDLPDYPGWAEIVAKAQVLSGYFGVAPQNGEPEMHGPDETVMEPFPVAAAAATESQSMQPVEHTQAGVYAINDNTVGNQDTNMAPDHDAVQHPTQPS